MELKLRQNELVSMGHEGSNRTFMELKFGSAIDLVFSLVVLIVPLWN